MSALGVQRDKAMSKLLDHMNMDRAMSGGRNKGISKAAGAHWATANKLTGQIQKLQRQKATDIRPLLGRLKKRLRKLF